MLQPNRYYPQSSRGALTGLALAAAAGGAWLLLQKQSQRRRMFDFRGKSVLITGGSRGLGLELARQFAAQGARVAICARDEQELRIAEAEIRTHGAADVLAIPCDLTDRSQANKMVEQVIARFGGIDVLVNNAGVIGVGPIEHVTIDDYHRAMDHNFWSAVHVAYHVAPHMQQRRSGRIVNISSVGGKIGVPHLTAYCASKFAVTGWSRSLRPELAKDGVLVTTVCPGLMRTGSPRHADFQGQHEKEYAWFKTSDSFPLLSVSVESAAHSIVEATRRGDVELIIGAAAKVGVLFDEIFPEWSGEMAALATSLLPGPGGIGEERRKGAECESEASRNIVTARTDRAAEAHNQLTSTR